MSTGKGIYGGSHLIKINKNFCKGCQICMHFCPKGVLGISDELNRIGYYYVYPEAIEKCIACGNCEKHCPDFAIRVMGEKGKMKVRQSQRRRKR